MSDRRPENLWVLKDIGPEWEIERPASLADLLAVVRRGVESGAIKGEVVRWCLNHRQIAWEDFGEDEQGFYHCRGQRCSGGAWVEGAGTWDCLTRTHAIIPVSDGGSET